MNGQYLRMWKEKVVEYFTVLPHLPGYTGGKRETAARRVADIFRIRSGLTITQAF